MPKKFFLTVLVCSLLLFSLSGCSLKYKDLFKKETPVANLPPDALFVDGPDIYDHTIKLINSAQKAIYVEQFEFDDPRLIQLLTAKARAGLDVRILLDQFRKVNRTTLELLKSQDISIQYYPARKGQSNRVKILSVDYNKAIVYGPTWNKNDWGAHDLAVQLDGKAAWWVATVFARDWEFTTTLALPVPKSTTASEDYIIPATNANVKQQIIGQISRATKDIWIEVSELSDQDTIRALTDATAKGIEIHLILTPSAAKNTPVSVDKLKAAGVEIRYFQDNSGRTTNMNFAIFDGKTFILTSSPWTNYMFVNDHEFSLTVPSPKATAKLVTLFQADWVAAAVTP